MTLVGRSRGKRRELEHERDDTAGHRVAAES